MGFLLELLLDVAFEIVIGIASALFPNNTKLHEWGESDSPLLRIVAFLIVFALVLLIAFLAYWFLIR